MSETVRDEWRGLAERPSAQVLIIGGGVNGVATFRDLALQGIDVVLVERGDISSGASAASSHMIHGGIRYLENGEFRLVHEAVVERNDLLRTARHYVRPLRTTIPIFSTFSGVLSAPLRFLRHGSGRPKERGAALIKIGLEIYDSFSRGGGRVPRHSFAGRRRSLRELPRLNPDLRYTATYWDASLRDPERLVWDLLVDGMAAGGDRARAVTYAAALGADERGVVIRDEASGEELAITASVVVNATGPWVDLTNGALGESTRLMGGTKGSHIVLDNPELLAATAGREIFFEHEDGRIVLVYPLKGRVLVGTTDLEHDMTEPLVCTDAEVEYFFDLIGHVFPGIRVDHEQIVYRYSGVRPLPGHGDLTPGFVSRDYRIQESELPAGTPQLTLVGGKWTTFRASAEHLTDRVLAVLGAPRRRSTAGLPIGGGREFPVTPRERERWIAAHADGIPADRVDLLLERYGTTATAVMAAIRADPADQPLREVPTYSTAEVRHVARTERVVHLADLLLRRSSLAFTGRATPAAIAELSALVGDALGWDAARVAQETTDADRAVHAADPSAATVDA